MTAIKVFSLLRQTGRTLNKPTIHPKPCIHAAMAVRVIRDHQALTENSPQQRVRDLGDSNVRVSDKQTLILLLAKQILDEKCRKSQQQQVIKMHCCSDGTLTKSLIN